MRIILNELSPLNFYIMFYLILFSTAGVLIWMQQTAWNEHRDPLHVANFLALLFGYSYVIEPLLLGNELSKWIRDPSDLVFVALFYLCCVSAFAIGLVGRTHARVYSSTGKIAAIPRPQLQRIAFFIAVVAVVIFVYGLQNAGGFVEAYSRNKGGAYFSSGYLGEAVNLGLLSILLIALSRGRMGLTIENWFIIGLGASPPLIQGTFGGRRGPLFLSLGAILAAIAISAKRRIKLSVLVGGLIVICLAVVFVASQRRHLHLGSEDATINWDKFTDRLLLAGTIDQGNNYVYGAGLIVTAWHTGKHTYGAECAVNILIRPIPKQLWPRKYVDIGATWITDAPPGYSIYSPAEWDEAVGWMPLSGSSSNSASDLFGEFSWLAILVYYFIGRAMTILYQRHRTFAELWTIVYLATLPLTIYFATQSFSAFYHRFLVMAIPAMLLWRFYGRYVRNPGRSRDFKEALHRDDKMPHLSDHVR